ncbi:aminotransferase class I/II-fold pyridoxal phosphate-dependent enzyme [Streptomyces halobius]|uniref:Aminotransferase n=1 Tax=Streptomyces halobius TaxID=2879846 RepID=A0ABY4MIX0_9ACTN|nr:aminotransferase class I/II-fold pyridoxal phosphate-dependent enzyme [Streptomyces halobius]UQA97297.1 aminotransferase class I/II-fold pyridoxal phosphate-dependent enzyme [Streptomyces halobius]
MIRRARRLEPTEDYLFSFIDHTRALADQAGLAPIPLGVGDCDLPTPPHIVAAMQQAVRQPELHRYPPYQGTGALREAATGFLERRYGLKADPATEVVVTLGSKEAMAHLALAFVEPGDVVLVPDPAYPVYATWARFCGGEVVRVPLREENGFLPDLDAIPRQVARRAKVFWICYPNNPTAALANTGFYDDLARFALEHNILVASDAAYAEIYYDTEPPPSFLTSPGAMRCGIEFHSLSKAYNMPGWRVGFATGNAEAVDALRTAKTHTDSGTFGAIQQAAVAALTDTTGYPDRLRAVYRERMRLLCDGLEAAGLEVLRPRATFYCLVRAPDGLTSEGFAKRLLEDARVLSIPATGFGPGGEGYVRLTVCADTSLITEAVDRITATTW